MATPSLSVRMFIWAVLLFLFMQLFQPVLHHFSPGTKGEPRTVTPRGDLAEDEKSTIALFKMVQPSVVYITTIRHVRDFWTRNIMRVPKGTGSGFIWDSQGHVVTNDHVLEDAQEARVTLANQESYDAILVGTSREHDLAVLRIDTGFNAPIPVPMGTSHDLLVGQKVFAIGNPFGLDYTLTTGIISALDRSIDNEVGGSIDHLIQTDAAINPGNSGGPLLDSAGRLIGINTAIYSPSGSYAGIGFAVPVDTVNSVIPVLIAKGRYQKPSLGITANDEISTKLLARYQVTGVLVLDVAPGSPAEKGGLRPTRILGDRIIPGDVILALDDRRLESVEDLQQSVSEKPMGASVLLTLWRQGETVKVAITLGGA
ncbi:MAG: trypsin-like peptidase domain-containing protein [Magnetococcales bacterium]|nr:trypsin-like peptidase domain-containing protein [Magnetococcales bacterium]